ncbi:MAG: class I SAM-dependent methyltransferase [Caldilineaceae bacterium]|nr:class I SAM-dependent methyltransferase [Caldilineaceae bacterium]
MNQFPTPKQLVAAGYDRIGETYNTWAQSVRVAERHRYTQLVLDRLPAGADLLELGCATGLLTTDQLAARFNLTGVDISADQIATARQRLPDTTWICADMTEVTFAPAMFDGVVAFYSIIHVPREEQPALFAKIAKWLRPGGLFVTTLTATATQSGYEADWLGAPMFWSGYDTATNIKLIKEAGLEIITATEETEEEFDEAITFLWVVAQKP